MENVECSWYHNKNKYQQYSYNKDKQWNDNNIRKNKLTII